jgi:hypothetical protein
MSINFTLPQKQLIYELIEEANPGFKLKVGEAQLKFTGAYAISPVGFRDTRVTVRSVDDVNVIGTKLLEYRRLNLTKLFGSRFLDFEYYLPGTQPITTVQVFEQISLKYGIKLLPADVNQNQTYNAGSPTSVIIKADSLCFSDVLRFTWSRGKQDITPLLDKKELPGRNWPVGLIDFQDGSKPQGEYLVYNADFTSQASVFEAHSSGGAVTAFIVNALNTKSADTGVTFSTGDSVTVKFGLSFCKATRYTLPALQVPEANAARFNRAVVIEAGPNGAWFFGKILVQYKV